MNRRDVEKYLSRFNINEPDTDLKNKILFKARADWEENVQTVPVHNFRLFKNCGYILTGIVLLSLITWKITERMSVRFVNRRPGVVQHIEEEITGISKPPREKNIPAVVKYTETDSEMKDLYDSVGLDYRTRQVFLCLRSENEAADSIGSLLERQKNLLKELEL